MVRADAVRWPRVFQRFALTQVAGLGFAAAPGTEDLHLADAPLPMPCHPYFWSSMTRVWLGFKLEPERGFCDR